MSALLADESWLAGRSEYAFMAACGGRHLRAICHTGA